MPDDPVNTELLLSPELIQRALDACRAMGDALVQSLANGLRDVLPLLSTHRSRPSRRERRRAKKRRLR
jgi:hypothetical protein